MKYYLLIFIVIIIFLGILWYNKRNKEGLSDQEIENLNSSIQSQVNEVAGVDPMKLSDSEEVKGLLNKMSALIKNEVNSMPGGTDGALSSAATAGSAGPPFDSTSRTYRGQLFTGTTKISDGFCQIYGTDQSNLNDKCGQLNSDSCNATSCCIFINGTKCVAGDASGPTFRTDSNGMDIDYTYYSHKNECYGTCGGIGNSANPCSIFKDTDKEISEDCLKRLWGQNQCPRYNYITEDVVNSLKDMTKAEIEAKFAIAKTDEDNYANCYGDDEANWPVPCHGKSDTSTGLSGRCITKLFTDVGCTNNTYIDVDFISTNSTLAKPEFINQFTALSLAQDDDSLNKCYGADETKWPDPCAGVPDTADFNKNEIPIRCIKKLWKESLECPNTEVIDYVYDEMRKKPPSTTKSTTFKEFKDSMLNPENKNLYKKSIFRSLCYGIDPNKWPDVPKVTPNPCANQTWITWANNQPKPCLDRISSVVWN